MQIVVEAPIALSEIKVICGMQIRQVSQEVTVKSMSHSLTRKSFTETISCIITRAWTSPGVPTRQKGAVDLPWSSQLARNLSAGRYALWPKEAWGTGPWTCRGQTARQEDFPAGTAVKEQATKPSPCPGTEGTAAPLPRLEKVWEAADPSPAVSAGWPARGSKASRRHDIFNKEESSMFPHQIRPLLSIGMLLRYGRRVAEAIAAFQLCRPFFPSLQANLTKEGISISFLPEPVFCPLSVWWNQGALLGKSGNERTGRPGRQTWYLRCDQH